MAELTQSSAWKALGVHRDDLSSRHLRDLFAEQPDRFPELTAEAGGLFLDYSKQRLTAESRDLLVELAVARGLPQAIEAMFAGEPINRSENRAAWHVALRAPRAAGYPDAVHSVLDAMAEFVHDVRRGAWLGFSGEPITDIVNIGIGGSDLGPRLVCDALAQPGDAIRGHFVANVDPDELDGVLAQLRPQTTLFVVTSKSFTTAETLANARAARDWLQTAGAVEADVGRHFVAVSTNSEAVAAFGIERMFGFWDWVGGRFSLWSAVGLPIALVLGMDVFRALLAGAHVMDRHFAAAPLADNLPVLMALIGVWNRNFLGLSGQVVAPYARRLAQLPAHLQQLEMESNGKSVAADGRPLRVATVPAVWGGVGTNAQHAFFQMLHQGSDVLPVDFVLPLGGCGERYEQLAANCLAQAEALMDGRDDDEVRAECVADGLQGDALEAAVAQRRFPGNRPSSLLLLPRLDARHLGALLAAYEHKVFVQGVVWGINSFDQWGVELGKRLAKRILAQWHDAAGEDVRHDASTAGLLRKLREASS